MNDSLRTDVAHSARVWNYWLGGKDHFAADRQMGEQVKAAYPGIVEVAKASRAFLVRAVAFLAAEAGIRQFLDIGTGLPTANNTHQVAQRVDPTCRIVYVDNDPLVLVHAKALLTSRPEGVCDYVDADVRDPEAILAAAAATLDFTRPVGLTLLGILGNVVDYDQARSIVRRLVDAIPHGSYMVVNDGTNVIDQKGRDQATQLSVDAGTPYIARSPQQIAAYFEGLDLLEPGVVSTPRWRPGTAELPAEIDVFCGIARKPCRGALMEITSKGFRVDLPRAEWRKSTRSGPNCDNCVEVAFVDGAVAVRDSKNQDGLVLIFTPDEWDAFVGGAKDGEFDLD